jgi:hypothetical protein
MDDGRVDRVPLSLVVFLAVCIAGGVLAAPFVPDQPPATATLPDLSGATIVEIRDAMGRPVLNGEFRSRIDPLGNEERDAALTDSRGEQVIGEVEIEIPGPQAARQEQELEIDIIRIAPSAKFALFIDDREILTFISDDRGSIDWEVSSGAPPAAPR